MVGFLSLVESASGEAGARVDLCVARDNGEVRLDPMSTPRTGKQTSRYNEPTFRRTALAPGILGAIILLAGFALLDSGDAFLWILFPVSILALIVAWFAFQARAWWWIPPLVAIAIVWNPIWPLGLSGPLWVAAQYVAVLVFVLAGYFIKVPIKAEDSQARRAR
jgi:hypothetical protein